MTTTIVSNNLLELAERCEAATGADRELDIAIALALPVARYGDKTGRFYNAGPYYEGAPDRISFKADDGTAAMPGNAPDMLVRDFTASVDAALTLVPEGHRWCCDSMNGQVASVFVEGGGVKAKWYVAATPALAICAAALRARAAQEAAHD